MNVTWAVVLLPVLVAVAVSAIGLGRPRWRPRLPVLVLLAGSVSLVVTAVHVLGAVRPVWGSDALGMVEGAALLVSTGLVFRYAPPPRAVVSAAATGLAAAGWLFRVFTPASPLEAVGVFAFWGLGALSAAGVGAYLRSLDVRQERAVADTRTALRLRLARDLHDFVAHDISEMVAHAQAGTVAGDPLRALERVEAAGQRALSVLDRTLDMLHHDRPLGPVGDLGGIEEAAARFSAAGPARVDLRLDRAVAVPVETAALAYRIVIEGLTNVRRHAPRATRVDLRVGVSAGALEIRLTNDGVSGARGRRRGGSGLPGLATLVAEQGGELVTGAVPDGWSLTARLPPAQSPAWSPESSSPTTRRASGAPSA
ncbi:sensor histidine kinase [Saccharothrix sp. NRRL B-16348]|uniref:sensor histidine kinase n=1 Tax=Saccharothrix sp. NRRL B-16348 TaxID=1415542 RepID=UPI0009EC3D1E|nr:histidine kinase [Saccharothrix sp. NRRL B-16348]